MNYLSETVILNKTTKRGKIMLKTKIIAAVCLGCTLGTTIAFSDTSPQDPYKNAITIARSEIWQSINSGKCGSAASAIMVDGKIVYAEGFGMANREQSIPVDNNTLFNIGSISKMYVTTAIMLLVDDGKIVLDTPVVSYLPEFKMADPRYKNITVRMLLNHTSGLPGSEYANSAGFKYNDKYLQEVLDTLSRSHLKDEPGAMATYCNDGFTLAEMIVQRVSGKKYNDFLNERIFSPLNLKNTGVSVGEIQGKPVAAYYDPKTGKIHPLETMSVLGAGGLATTAADLCGFMEAFAPESKLLTKQSLAEMRKAQPSSLQRQLKKQDMTIFGLGWDMTNLPRYSAAGIQVLSKGGGTGNYSSMVFTVPDKKIAVAVLASGASSGATEIALHILDAVLIDKKFISKEEKPILIPIKAQIIPQRYTSFSGYYATGSDLIQVVFDSNKKVVNLYKFKDKEKSLIMSLVYNNGYFYDPQHNCLSFLHINNADYIVTGSPDAPKSIGLQKIKPIAKPQSLATNMDNTKWLRRNVYPLEEVASTETHFVKSLLYKELPGYVYFNGIKKIETPKFAGMPFNAVRDQSELTLIDVNGMTWAQVSDTLYNPASIATPLKNGDNDVKIGDNGFNEWLVTNNNTILSFVKPKNGRIIVFSPGMESIYDSAIDTGDIYVTKGSYIEVAGFANDVFVVKSRRK